MRVLRQGTPPKEKWNAQKLAEHLNIDIDMAKNYFKEYHDANGGGYGDVEKHLILDFVNQKQREEREREARYKSDLSNVESITYLKEQVKFSKASALIANIIALLSLAVSIVAICLKVC